MKMKRLFAGLIAATLLVSSVMVAMANECNHVLSEKLYFDYVPCFGGWKAVDENYPYDYYYACTECYLVIDENGNQLDMDYFDADPDAKHVPDFSEEYPESWVPCAGGYKGVHYNCSACGQYTDADGNTVEYMDAEPDARHNPELGGDVLTANYSTCSGGYKEDRYPCIDCGAWVNKDGIEIEREDGDGKHTANKEGYFEPDWTPCGGGYKEKYYICANEHCDVYVDARGKEVKYFDAIEDASHDLKHIPEAAPTCEEDGFMEYWVCNVCGDKFADENGEDYLFFEEDYIIEALGHNLKRVDRVEPTYELEGMKEHWVCENCGVIFADPNASEVVKDEKSLVIPKLEVTPEDIDKEAETDKKDEVTKSDNTSKVPETGDVSRTGLLTGMMIMSAAYLVLRKRYIGV